jgi:tetratricopeptide (TPR) repeat protein
VVGLVQVGFQAMADRYAYIPLIGLFIAVTWGLSALTLTIPLSKPVSKAAGAAVLAGLAFLTGRQVLAWADSIVLFERALCVKVAAGKLCRGENHPLALPAKMFQKRAVESGLDNNLLRIMLRRNNLEAKITSIEKMILADPQDQNRKEEYERLSINKKYLDHAIHRYHAGLYEAYGMRYQHSGQYDRAAFCYRQALSIQPNSVRSLYGLAIVYAMQGRYDHALCYLKKWMDLQPAHPTIYYLAASMYAQKDQPQKAAAMLKQAAVLGYSAWEQLDSDKNFDKIRFSRPYQEFIRRNLPFDKGAK